MLLLNLIGYKNPISSSDNFVGEEGVGNGGILWYFSGKTLSSSDLEEWVVLDKNCSELEKMVLGSKDNDVVSKIPSAKVISDIFPLSNAGGGM